MSSRLLPQLSPPMSKKSTDMVINVNQGTSKSSISSDIIHTDFDMTGIEKSCAQAVLAAARRRRVERATAATESIKKSLSEGGVGMVIRDSSDKLARSARLLLVKSSQARANASQARIRAEKSFGWASKTIEGNRALVVARRSGDKAAEARALKTIEEAHAQRNAERIVVEIPKFTSRASGPPRVASLSSARDAKTATQAISSSDLETTPRNSWTSSVLKRRRRFKLFSRVGGIFTRSQATSADVTFPEISETAGDSDSCVIHIDSSSPLPPPSIDHDRLSPSRNWDAFREISSISSRLTNATSGTQRTLMEEEARHREVVERMAEMYLNETAAVAAAEVDAEVVAERHTDMVERVARAASGRTRGIHSLA